MKLAVVGATGMVGKEILEVISERDIPIKDIFLVSSEKSIQKSIIFRGKSLKIISLEQLLSKKVDLALFAAGSEVSKIWAPKMAENGCKVIDNSSFWRMSSNHKLIIPEINGWQLKRDDMIIANPNCSTIQLLMVLAPLHKDLKIKRVIVSTYQSVSGSGKKAVEQLQNEEMNVEGKMAYPHNIYRNVIPHCDDFLNNGYTKEEMKITNETKKILDKNIDIVATAARVPVIGGHSESVNITFNHGFDLKKIKDILEKTAGVKVLDNISKNVYPMPINSYKKNEVFVGRIRKDFTLDKTLNLWITADNLRKGAATNAVQIAEYLINKNML